MKYEVAPTKEQEMLAKPKINKVVQAAKVEFNNHGILNSKIKNIAKRSNIGEASFYRYFKDKTELVNLIAYEIWTAKSILFEQNLQTTLVDAKTGLDYLMGLFDLFVHFYEEHKDMLKFMEDYGNYLVLIDPEQRSNTFSYYMASVEEQIDSFVQMGLSDHSLRDTFEAQEVYDFFLMSLIPTIQSLAIRGLAVSKNPEESSKRLLNNIRKAFEFWIKNKAS